VAPVSRRIVEDCILSFAKKWLLDGVFVIKVIVMVVVVVVEVIKVMSSVGKAERERGWYRSGAII
jgi:hypothetical protein